MANVVIVVEVLASLGILSSALLSIMKLILQTTAKTMAKINFQLKIRRRILSKFNRFPDMRDLSPISTIDNVFAMQ